MPYIPRSRAAWAGTLISITVVLAVARGLGAPFPAAVAALPAWIALILLWPRIGPRQHRQTLALGGIGLVTLAIGLWRGATLDIDRLAGGNLAIIAMLAAVSFLRLIARPSTDSNQNLPRGRSAVWQTLVGVHLFGAFINISSVFIMGDRIASHGRLGKRRALALTRGFATAAFWSPFFASMATALIYAPGAQVNRIMLFGLPLAAIALILAGRDLDPEGPMRAAPMVGYPFTIRGLFVPMTLFVLVATLHILAPDITIPVVIALVCPLLALTWLMVRKPREGLIAWRQHITRRLADGSNEVALFLAAGVLAAGLVALLSTLPGWLPWQRFGPLEATLTLLAMVGLSAVGMHPVIAIATIGPTLAPIQPDPTLLAMVFVQAWGVGVIANPLSGIHLAMQGRYGIDGMAFQRWNAAYVPTVLALAITALWIYGWAF